MNINIIKKDNVQQITSNGKRYTKVVKIIL